MRFISYKPKSKEYILLKENKQKYATDLQTLLKQPEKSTKPPKKKKVRFVIILMTQIIVQKLQNINIQKVKLNNY